MTQTAPPEAILTEHLPRIGRVAASIARRHALRDDVAAEFESWVRLKLVEDDYAVLRKFRGESSLDTYLAVVIARLFRDFRAREWGRWRPSAAAQRRGRLAVRLEMLLYRDRFSLNQAVELLLSSEAGTNNRRALLALARELPARPPLRPIAFDSELTEAVAEVTSADRAVNWSEIERERERTHVLLHEAIGQLDPEDRVIMRARYWDGLSVADIARMLGLEQKPLYRRLERLHARVRASLEASGVRHEDVLADFADD